MIPQLLSIVIRDSGKELMKQTESKKASLFSEATPPGESQRFIKNSRYFTICVYGVVMLLITAIIFKAIIDFDKTKAWFGQVLGMLSPSFSELCWHMC